MHSTKISVIFFHFLFLSFLTSCNLTSCSGSVGLDVKGGSSGSSLYTGNAIISWNSPTTYDDGSTLPPANITGYRIYIRTSSTDYNPAVYYFVSAPTTTCPIKNLSLPIGQYYLAVTTMDTSDIESVFSNEVLADLK